MTNPHRPCAADTDTSSAPRASCRLHDWELVRLAALGHVSRVYQARAAGQSLEVAPAYAVKLLDERHAGNAQAAAQLMREACVGRAVCHSHLAPILAAHVTCPPYYVVLPWLAGATLDSLLRRGVRPSVAAALWIARQTCEALEALDRGGWTHADVKPSNVFISPRGHVTLLDLGFARHRDERQAWCERTVAGTPEYMAPETITSSLRPDIRSDFYSLGVMLYRLLSGHLPFVASDLGELLRAHRQAEPPELRRIVPTVPQEVSHLVRDLMSKEPLRRPQTPRELIDRLARLEIACFADRAAA